MNLVTRFTQPALSFGLPSGRPPTITMRKQMESSENQCWVSFMATVSRKTRSGQVLSVTFAALSLLSFAVLSGLGIFGWATAAILISLILSHCASMLKYRYHMVSWLAFHPKEVFWVHPNSKTGLAAEVTFEQVRNITFHLRNGYTLEVDIDPSQRSDLAEWLKTSGDRVIWGPWQDNFQMKE